MHGNVEADALSASAERLYKAIREGIDPFLRDSSSTDTSGGTPAMTARKRARYGPDRGVGEQEPRSGGDHHEQVKAAETGTPVVLEMADAHYVVDSEHQPGGNADHDTDPAMDLRTTTSGKMADTTIGSRILASKRSRKAASRSERGRPGRCRVSEVTSTVSIVPERRRPIRSTHGTRSGFPAGSCRRGRRGAARRSKASRGPAPENRGADASLRIWERRTR